MLEHKIKTYKDGMIDVPFCSVCGQEGLELNSECPGKFIDKVEDKNIDKKPEHK